jgi:hypothetical protein
LARRVQRVDVRDAGVLRNTSCRALARNLVKHTFRNPRRDDPLTWLFRGTVCGHP